MAPNQFLTSDMKRREANCFHNGNSRMEPAKFLTTDLQQVVARWLKEGRCKPIPLDISAKFYTDLDTYIDLPTCESLLEANKHYIKKENGRSTNPPRTSKTL